MQSQEQDIHITGYNKKGWGTGVSLSTESEKQYEIPYTVIGDKLKALIYKKQKKAFIGSIVEVVSPSSSRITPKCIHATTCGGCSWQQVAYSDQLLAKQSFIEKLFTPHLEQDTILFPIIGAENQWNYRNKMEFSFSQDKLGNRYLGLIQTASKGRVLNLEECHLTPPWMVQVLLAIKAWWDKEDIKAYNMYKQEGILRNLTVREGVKTGEKLIMLSIAGDPHERFSQGHINRFKEAILSCFKSDEVISLFLQVIQTQVGTPTQTYEMHLHGPDHIKERLEIDLGTEVKILDFKVSPSSFFQPNPRQAEKLFSRALELVAKRQDMTIYDLYCGAATLGMIFSHLAKKVIGVEINPYAVFDSEVNMKFNNIKNVEVHKGDVKAVLDRLKAENKLPTADLVIVDPPRAGLDAKALEHLIHLMPQEILYISCNPTTQRENIEVLINQGYSLKTLQPVDLFPHTPHIENIAILQKIVK